MRIGSLYSGIGGLDVACEWARGRVAVILIRRVDRRHRRDKTVLVWHYLAPFLPRHTRQSVAGVFFCALTKRRSTFMKSGTEFLDLARHAFAMVLEEVSDG